MQDAVSPFPLGMKPGIAPMRWEVCPPRQLHILRVTVSVTGVLFLAFVFRSDIPRVLTIGKRAPCVGLCLSRPAVLTTTVEWVKGRGGWADPELRVRGLALHRFSSAEAAQCLAAANHSLVFVGDSVTRYQYISLVKFLDDGTWPDTGPESARHPRKFEGTSKVTATPCLLGAAASRAVAAVRALLPHMRCPHTAVLWRGCCRGRCVTATTQRGPLGGRSTSWREGTTGSHRRPPPMAAPHYPPTLLLPTS